MEETLGKRIAANRKRLSLTQDALAEQLGITAQAVSKWENDQSCPDISMLPKLAQVFGVTTDELLGITRADVPAVQAVPGEPEPDTEPEGFHVQKGNWEFQWDGGRKSSIGIGVWVLLVGGLLLFSELIDRNIGLLNLLWPSALLVFGLFGIYPRFSILRLGCGLFGAYCLLDMFHIAPFGLDLGLMLPLFLLLAGLHLVLDALRKPKNGKFHVMSNGKSVGGATKDSFTYSDEGFECTSSFGETRHLIQLPRLRTGHAELSFGEMTLDLSGCEEIAEDCQLDLKCSFGELEVLVPRKWNAIVVSSTAFGSVDTKGSASADAKGSLQLNCNASFGEITVRYL